MHSLPSGRVERAICRASQMLSEPQGTHQRPSIVPNVRDLRKYRPTLEGCFHDVSANPSHRAIQWPRRYCVDKCVQDTEELPYFR